MASSPRIAISCVLFLLLCWSSAVTGIDVSSMLAKKIGREHSRTDETVVAKFGASEGECKSKGRSSIVEKFRRGQLLVHMTNGVSDPEEDTQRWARKGHLDYGLSFSLIHPQMAHQKLWLPSGYLLDGAKCEVLAGCRADLWVNNMVQHNASQILTTPEGRRAELLRLLWLKYSKNGEQDGGPSTMHAVLPDGFRKWATNPDDWSPYETEVFTMENPFFPEDTMSKKPTDVDFHAMLTSMDAAGQGYASTASDFSQLASAVATDYNSLNLASRFDDELFRVKFSEVFAMCPLAVQGFVYSVPSRPVEDWLVLRATASERGDAVLRALRDLPGLAKRTLVIAEYMPSSEEIDSPEKFASLMAYPSFEELQNVGKAEGNLTVRWNEKGEAKLTVVKVDCPRVYAGSRHAARARARAHAQTSFLD